MTIYQFLEKVEEKGYLSVCINKGAKRWTPSTLAMCDVFVSLTFFSLVSVIASIVQFLEYQSIHHNQS